MSRLLHESLYALKLSSRFESLPSVSQCVLAIATFGVWQRAPVEGPRGPALCFRWPP